MIKTDLHYAKVISHFLQSMKTKWSNRPPRPRRMNRSFSDFMMYDENAFLFMVITILAFVLIILIPITIMSIKNAKEEGIAQDATTALIREQRVAQTEAIKAARQPRYEQKILCEECGEHFMYRCEKEGWKFFGWFRGSR